MNNPGMCPNCLAGLTRFCSVCIVSLLAVVDVVLTQVSICKEILCKWICYQGFWYAPQQCLKCANHAIIDCMQ